MSVALDDRGFTLGHGLFETVLWDGALRFWDEHLARLRRGCAVLGMPAPDLGECLRVVEHALSAPSPLAGEGVIRRMTDEGSHSAVGAQKINWQRRVLRDPSSDPLRGPPSPARGEGVRVAIRLNWSAGVGGRGLDMPSDPKPVLTATAAPAPLPIGPATLVTASVRRNDTSPASRLKTLSYLDNVLARAEAKAAGVDEALMLNTRGEVACAAAANIFWVEGEMVCTPALECGVLDGIERARVMGACARLGIGAEERRAPLEALIGRPLFLTNSLIGVRAVSRLDGAEVPASPLVAALEA